MKRVLFKLSIPGNNSWNGKWSGDGGNYTITKSVTDKRAKELGLSDNCEKDWYHNFGDGWTACITGRVLSKGERVAKSRGFYGYDWMVKNIWLYGNTQGDR